MASIFTEHVRNFGTGSDPSGAVVAELSKLLKFRMRRRNLLSGPPSYLGYTEANWSEPGAMEDLAHDCYVFAFLKRMSGLRNQLKVRANIDGLITRNVDNFLLELQRKHDPVGYAVFGNVDAAVMQMEAMGQLQVQGRDAKGRLHNTSVLRLGKGTADQLSREQIDESLQRMPDWTNAVPHLVATTDKGQDWVADFLHTIQGGGGVLINVGDMVAALAIRSRAIWSSLRSEPTVDVDWEGDGDLAQLVRFVRPDQGVDQREYWTQLKEVVPQHIATLDKQLRVRERLDRVFAGLIQMIEEGDAEPPKQADLVDRLSIPRATIADDFGTLRKILEKISQENTPKPGRRP